MHGFAKFCQDIKSGCHICKTPWPIKEKTPIEMYLESIGYYNRYELRFYPSNKDDGLSNIGGYFSGGYLNLPKGMNGSELIDIAKILKPEYDILTKGTAEQEVNKRGAAGPYDQEQIPKT